MKTISYDREKKVIVAIENDEEVILRPKERELWHYLIEQSPNIVSRKSLEIHIWEGRYVTDFTINQTINSLRRKIGDSSREIIITKPRQGYTINVEKIAAHVAPEREIKSVVETTHNREKSSCTVTEDLTIKPKSAIELTKHIIPEYPGKNDVLPQTLLKSSTHIIDKLIKTLPLIFILIGSNAASIGVVAMIKKDKKSDIAYIDGYQLNFSSNGIEYVQDEGRMVKCSLLRRLADNDGKEEVAEGTLCKVSG